MTQRYVLEALKRAIIWKDLYKSINGEFLELYTQHQTGRKLKCLHTENGVNSQLLDLEDLVIHMV